MAKKDVEGYYKFSFRDTFDGTNTTYKVSIKGEIDTRSDIGKRPPIMTRAELKEHVAKMVGADIAGSDELFNIRRIKEKGEPK